MTSTSTSTTVKHWFFFIFFTPFRLRLPFQVKCFFDFYLTSLYVIH